jgi:hypothetical protein
MVQFMQFGDQVLPDAGWNSVTKLHKLYYADEWLRTPNDEQKDCPEHVEL